MFFLQGLYEGIINGSILALVAMGIALVWGVMNILSFSQGEFLMLGMFVSYYVNMYLGLDPILAMPISAAVLFVLGVLIYKTIIARALKGPILSQRLITFALSMVLVYSAQLCFGAEYKTIPNPPMFQGSIDLGVIVVAKQKLVPFILALIIAGFMFWFLRYTRMGKAIQATSMDRYAAGLVGINPDRAYTIAFAMASAVAGAAGCALLLLHVSQRGRYIPALGTDRCCDGRLWQHYWRVPQRPDHGHRGYADRPVCQYGHQVYWRVRGISSYCLLPAERHLREIGGKT